MAAPPNFGLVLRSSNPLVKREVQYMGKVYGKYIDFGASTTKKHVPSLASQANFGDFENLKHIF